MRVLFLMGWGKGREDGGRGVKDFGEGNEREREREREFLFHFFLAILISILFLDFSCFLLSSDDIGELGYTH